MTEKPTVLVDMDGVLADFDAEVQYRLWHRHPEIQPVRRNNFYVADDYPEDRDLVDAISNEEGFFRSLPLIQNAFDGWQRIIDLGYYPQICSAPKKANPNCEAEKLEWLREYFVPKFGKYVVEEAIITRYKHLQKGIVLIDDRPEVRHSNQAEWQHIIFDRPYNRHIEDKPRLKGWNHESLSEILELANKISNQ